MEEWIKRSWFFQQAMNEQIGDRCWDLLDTNEAVTSKIDYALSICYGPNYKGQEKYKNVFNDVNKKVLSYYPDSKLCFSCTFVNILMDDNKGEGIFCVFWLKKDIYAARSVCIDRDCRTYENWESFIEDNLLPECNMIYPRGGQYALDRGEFLDYIDLVSEKSNACSTWNRVKRYSNIVSTVVGCAGVAVLMFNPITAPIGIVAVAATLTGGAVNTLCAADKLLDIHRHEGIDMTKARSLFAVADVVFSALGTAAVGVTAGSKLLSTSSKFFAESALALKFANSSTTVCKIVSCVSSAHLIVNIIYKYVTGLVAEFDFINLGQMLLFSFNVYVCAPMLRKLVEFMSRCNLHNITKHLTRIKNKAVAFVGRVREIKNFNELLEFIVPAEMPFLKKISNHELIKPIFKTFDNFSESETQNPIALMYDIMSELPNMFKSVDEYFKQSQQKIKQHYDKKTCDKIEKWASSDGLDWNNSNFSSYNSKINMPIDIKNKVDETLKSLSRGNTEKALLQKSDSLYNALLEILSKSPMKSYSYAINKVNYFCEIFKDIFSRIIDRHYFEYFLFTMENGFENDRNAFFEKKMLVSRSLLDTVFSESLSFLQQNLCDINLSYEREMPEFETVSDKVIHKFQMPKDTELNQDFYYSTAVKYMPEVMSGKKNMVFEKHFDSLAILTCAGFKLLFYTYNSLDGLLIYLKNIDSDESVKKSM